MLGIRQVVGMMPVIAGMYGWGSNYVCHNSLPLNSLCSCSLYFNDLMYAISATSCRSRIWP